MNLLSTIRAYYLFFCFGFFFLSQNTLNLTYAQDVVVIIDDIESRLTVRGDFCHAGKIHHISVEVDQDFLKKEQMVARRKDSIEWL